MLFAILFALSLGWAHAIVAVLGGSAVCYLYVYVFRMWVEAALVGPVLAVLSIFLMPVRRQINRYGSGLSGREALAHLLIDVKRRLHGGSSVCVGWSVV